MNNLPKRKPNRLGNYDYSDNGVYFITICSKEHKCIFSKINVGATIGRPITVNLSNIGVVIESGINGINEHYENVFVDNYVIMPNHIHLIIRINNDNGRPMVAPTVGRVIQQFKGLTTKQAGKPIWQKSFYDHIIRDEYDYQTKWQYVEENPIKWMEDELYNSTNEQPNNPKLP